MERASENTARRWWPALGRRAARAYIAGPALEDGLRVCRALARRRLAGTIGFWEEQGDDPRRVADAHIAALAVLSGEPLDCSLSVKATALGFSRNLLGEILDHAGRRGASVHFDSLGQEAADETFSLITEARANFPMLGCTLPGRWHRSLLDADRAVELRLGVRVVKGQWADPEDPKVDRRAGFLAVVDRLAGRARHVGVATHDLGLAREALGRLLGAGTSCELELLLGLPLRRAIRLAREAGVPARVYVPYGHGCLPYRLSQAYENPRALWWFVRDLLLGRAVPRFPSDRTHSPLSPTYLASRSGRGPYRSAMP